MDALGVPTNQVLAEASRDVSKVESGEFTVLFAFADPPAVTANQVCALVLSKTGSRIVSWKGHRTASCAGGVFQRDSSSTLFEQTPPADLDLIFTTVVIS